MTINTGRFELVLSQKLGAINSGTSSLDLLAHARVIQQLKSGTVSVVDTFGSLPSAAANVGRLYFVQDSEELFWSNAEYGWLPITTREANTLWAWGVNTDGGLGDSTVLNRSSPVTATGGPPIWCQTNTGSLHTIGIKLDGTIWTWGSNAQGRLGDPSVSVRRSSPGTVAGGGTTWCISCAGLFHSSAVKTDGTLWTWGYNGVGQLGDNTITNKSSPVTTSGGGTNWCVVSLDNRQTSAIKTDGTLWTWGENGFGQLGDNTITSRRSPGTTAGGGTTWCSTGVGTFHMSGVKTDGTLWTWGINSGGQLGDGTVTSRRSPVTTSGGGTDWCVTHNGSNHTVAVKVDGTLWTWGCNGSGQLGNNTITNRSSPGTTLNGGTTWCNLSAGCSHTAAIKSDGTVWTWGLNDVGQLGTGYSTNQSSPVSIGSSTSWCMISSGNRTTAGIQTKTF